MNILFDQQGQPRKEFFQEQLWQQTHQLTTVLKAVADTLCARIESTHFLIALVKIPGGLTQNFFRLRGFAPQELEQGLSGCISVDPQTSPPEVFTPSVLDDSARRMIAALERDLKGGKLPHIDEGRLLQAALEALTPQVANTFKTVQLDPTVLVNDLLQELRHYTQPAPFTEDGTVSQKAFTPGGGKVLALLKTEAEALGYTQMDPRHL